MVCGHLWGKKEESRLERSKDACDCYEGRESKEGEIEEL